MINFIFNKKRVLYRGDKSIILVRDLNNSKEYIDFYPVFKAFEMTSEYKRNGFRKCVDILGNQYNCLTRRDLDSIKKLTLVAETNDASDSLLNQIDTLLPNLEELDIEAYPTNFNFSSNYYRSLNRKLYAEEQRVAGKNSNAECYYLETFDLKNMQIVDRETDRKIKCQIADSFFASNQISDENLSHIQKLSNLKVLSLQNQTKITKIDLKNFQNLTKLDMKNCINLKTVENFPKTNLKEKIIYDFTGDTNFDLDTLNRIKNFYVENNPQSQKNKVSMMLPMDYLFGHKTRHSAREFASFCDLASKDVFWTQISAGVSLNHCSRDALDFACKLDKIYANCTSPENDDLTNLSNCYQWICQNIRYEADDSNDHDDFEYFVRISENPLREANQDRASILRSCVYALKNKMGVCVAFSDLFRFLAMNSDSVESTRPVGCAITYDVSDETYFPYYPANHQICAIKFRNGNVYYFDPTFDEGNLVEFPFFALTKKKIQRDRNLLYNEKDTQNATELSRNEKLLSAYDDEYFARAIKEKIERKYKLPETQLEDIYLLCNRIFQENYRKKHSKKELDEMELKRLSEEIAHLAIGRDKYHPTYQVLENILKMNPAWKDKLSRMYANCCDVVKISKEAMQIDKDSRKRNANGFSQTFS